MPGSKRVVSLFWAVLAAAACCYAQSNLAGVSGVVTDPSGGTIPDAIVAATNTQTGVATGAKTNTSGYYNLENLPIGSYSISIEHPGFRKYVHENITLTTGQQLGLDVQLQVGETGQAVTVSAEAPLTETRTSDVGQLVESKSIEGLPLGNRRTLNVVQLSGAAVFVSYPINTPANVNPNFSLAGGRTQSQMAWIDGSNAQNIRIGAGQINMDPPVEAVEEVKVLSNNYAAEYGGSAGGVIIEATKSGANALHGSAYEFLRNNAFDAPGFFAPVKNGAKVSPELRYNVFGATAGGPIRKDKTFFFFSYEGTRLDTGSTNVLTVPTPLQRTGDFSQTLTAAGKLIPIYDPNSTQLVSGSYVRTQFPGNVIPASAMDPVGTKILDYYPLPNQAASNLAGANNFSGNEVVKSPADFYMIKIDHNLGEKDKFTGRYMRIAGTTGLGSIYPNNGAGDPTNFSVNRTQYVFGSWTRILSATRINDLRFTFNDRIFHNLSAGIGGDYPQKLGLNGVPEDAFPQISPAGFSGLGSTQQERRQYPIRQEQFVDNFSWIRGRHAMKFGFEARRSFDQDILLNSVSGAFTFSTQPTGLPGNASTGNGLASMLVGFPTGFSELETQTLDRSSWYLAGFVQDDWTVSSSLTLNLGLRWETDTPMVDQHNRMNSFDASQINPVSGTPGVVKFLGLNGYPTQPYATDWNNFGPRFGFAWKVFNSDKTVVRGGFGIFFAHPFDAGVPTANTLGFSLQATLNSPDNGITAPFLLRNGVPVQPTAPALNDSFGAVPAGQNPNTAVTYFEGNRATGYSEQFNVGIQRQLPGSMVIEVTALGNLSRKLAVSNLSIDQIAPNVLTAQHDTQAYRPYPQFSNVSIQSPTLGVSNYYAGMIRIEKRYSYGLNFGANYTWSKLLGNLNDVGAALGNDNGPFQNYYNRSADYGPLSLDVRHRVSLNTFYDLPFGPGKRWLAHNPFGYVAGGWSLGLVGTIQTGPPVTVVTQTNSCNCFSAGSQRANVVANPNLPSGQRTVTEWFNTAAFAQPANLTFGNEGVGIVRAPGMVDFDLSLARMFRITEKIRAELRGEFFNTFNHTNLGLPGLTFGASTFGVISSSGPGRQIELGARLLF
ncbi:MAG TPA: carboxypeptidase regulatory-like domain-containing protein [Bryobacteraceae bacterium]|nr:carboxypeptidase regulatory-like domain-containing protein [Bryobacteraceae bacterium]